MRISSSILAVLTVSIPSITDGFTTPTATTRSFTRTPINMAAGEFEYLLGEGTASTNQLENALSTDGKLNIKNMIRLPDTSAAATATLTSSVTFDEVSGSAEALEGDDVFGDGAGAATSTEQQAITDPRLAELIRTQEKRAAMKSQPTSRPPIKTQMQNFLKGKDFGEIFFTVLVPVIGGYYLTKEAYARVSTRVGTKQEETLEDYANEMIYHDGDFDEMKLAHSDYSKRLAFMGPKKGDTMIKKYLEYYAKKKTVSPQAISSLSYVFSMYKLTEERAAAVLCELCATMPEKIASAGKLLFFGTHILKSKEGQAKLQPIKDLLASSYRDGGVVSGEEIVTRSQIAMGEAAYRSAVAAAGKKQSDLTIGWEVLGLDKETATVIFEEVAKDGFMSGREAKYGRAYNIKYDSKGRKVDDSDSSENPEEADDDNDDDNIQASGNVQECTECGYTLFVAEGRDFKFFGSGFVCPECGAPKDKFKAVDMSS